MRVEVEAGQKHSAGVDISVPGSLISLSLQVEDYDIKVGLYRASQLSEFQLVEDNISADPLSASAKGKRRDTIHHSLAGSNPYECLIDYKLIEKAPNAEDVTLNYLAVEPGFYRIVFSNQHSWMRKKVVLFRYCVLTPVGGAQEAEAAGDGSRISQADIAPSKNLMDLLDDEPEVQGTDLARTQLANSQTYQPPDVLEQPRLNAFDFMNA